MNDAFAEKIVFAQAAALKRGALAIWTVYDQPTDYPVGYIARLHEVADGKPKATGMTLVGTLEEMRTWFERAGLAKIARSPGDEPQIVEVWL
jgi:hypothetical protein